MRALLMVFMCSVTLAAQQPAPATVTNQDLLAGLPTDGSKWLLYHGNYSGHRFSPLTQITPQNVNQLKAQWTFQTRLTPNFQTTPLLVDNVLYVTGFNGTAWAIDARSGRQIWAYRRNMPDDFRGCCGPNNRGFAVHGDKLFLGTGDAHLVALDMKTGDVVWDVELADYKKGYSATVAPIVVKDKVIIGIAGAEFGIRGFIDAYDVNTGKTGLALPHGGRTRRAGRSDLAEGIRRLPARWRIDLGVGHLRSRAEPACSSEPETRARTTTARRAKATTCTRARPSRWTPTPAS